MSKKENHWYIVGSTVHALSKSMRPRAWQLALWLLLVTLFVIGFQSGALESWLKDADSPAFVPVLSSLVVGLALGAGFGFRAWRQSRARADYMNGLQHPGPEKLIDGLTRLMKKARALPDADAFSAQSRAIGYALYGCGEDAATVLAEVNWGAKAPLIQAVGLSVEGIVEVLCRRNPQRALELNRTARSLASISSALPGAAQTERYHGVCVAVSEVLLNIQSPESLKWLDEAAADGRFPPLQLLASFGLAVSREHSGDTQGASQLRARILAVAPHCSPLQLKSADFSAAGQARPGSPTPVFSSRSFTSIRDQLGDGHAGVERIQERAAKQKLTRAAGVTIGLWVLLIVMFVAIWLFFNQAK